MSTPSDSPGGSVPPGPTPGPSTSASTEHGEASEVVQAVSASTRKGLIWRHFAVNISAVGAVGGRVAKNVYKYKCQHCSKELTRRARPIDASDLVAHTLSCPRTAAHMKIAVAGDSKSAVAKKYLAAADYRATLQASANPLSVAFVSPVHSAGQSSSSLGVSGGSSGPGISVPPVLSRLIAPAALAPRESPPTVQRGRISRYADTIRPDERQDLDLLFAMYIIGEAISFSGAESPFLIAFLQTMRPAYVRDEAGNCLVPTRQRIAGSLLERVAEVVRAMVAKKEAESCGPKSFCFDGSGIQRRHCLNVLSNTCEGMDIFVECINTGEDRVTGEYMAEIMIRHIEKAGIENVCSIASDNTASVVKARRIVCKKFPSLTDVGDGPHCVDLLIEDIAGEVDEFTRSIEHSKVIISFVKGHPYVDALHQNICEELKVPSRMEYFPDTRFAYLEKMVTMQIGTKKALLEMVSARMQERWDEAVSTIAPGVVAEFFALVRSVDTWDDFEGVLEYAKPLSGLTHSLESSSMRFSDIVPMASTCLYGIQSTSCRSVSSQSHDKIVKFCRRRLFGENAGNLVVLVRDEHIAASALDPIFRAQTLSPEQMGAVSRVIDKFFGTDNVAKKDAAKTQLSDFSLKMGSFSPIPSSGLIWAESTRNFAKSIPDIMRDRLASKREAAVKWWLSFGIGAPELQAIGIALASTSGQAVSADRSFSIQKLIHTSSRNSLSSKNVDLLLFCYFNLRSLHNLSGVRRVGNGIDDLTQDILTASDSLHALASSC